MKFILEFDGAPALVFVQEKAGDACKLYQDGELVRGIKAVRIDARVDCVTKHEVEFVTGRTD